MDIFEAIKSRRAVHNFLPGKEMTDGQIKELFEYVRLTPSGYNIQPWQFVVVRDQERKKELREIAFDQKQVEDAAINVIVLGDTNFATRADEVAQQWLDAGYFKTEEDVQKLAHAVKKKRDEETLQLMATRNVGLVSMTLMLAAEGMGLATCPMMGFSKWRMAKFLELPDYLFPGMLIPVGYRDESVSVKERLPRRSFEELVRFERWSE